MQLRKDTVEAIARAEERAKGSAEREIAAKERASDAEMRLRQLRANVDEAEQASAKRARMEITQRPPIDARGVTADAPTRDSEGALSSDPEAALRCRVAEAEVAAEQQRLFASQWKAKHDKAEQVLSESVIAAATTTVKGLSWLNRAASR